MFDYDPTSKVDIFVMMRENQIINLLIKDNGRKEQEKKKKEIQVLDNILKLQLVNTGIAGFFLYLRSNVE